MNKNIITTILISLSLALPGCSFNKKSTMERLRNKTDTVDSITISNLTKFLDSGKGVFFAQGGVSTDMQIQQATPINSNIFDFLKSYGFTVNQNLVLDKSCG